METKLNGKPSAGVESCVFDRVNALARMEGDAQLLEELAQIFLEECPEILQRLRDAVECGDAAAVAAEAHSMKGSVSTFGADSATELAWAMEKMGRERSLGSAPETLRRLEEKLALLMQALAHLGEEAALSER